MSLKETSFTPRKNMYGPVYSFLLSSLGLLFGAIQVVELFYRCGTSWHVINIALLLLIGVPLLIVPWIFLGCVWNARYIIGESSLTIKACGKSKTLCYRDIEAIYKKNLRFHPQNTGWRIPGAALFWVTYADEGIVYMVATSVLKGITIIRLADGSKYGINPNNEYLFYAFLREKNVRVMS